MIIKKEIGLLKNYSQFLIKIISCLEYTRYFSSFKIAIWAQHL